MTPGALIGILAAANASVDAGLRIYLAVKDLPEAGTPEEVAKQQELKARLAARAAQIEALPIFDVDAS